MGPSTPGRTLKVISPSSLSLTSHSVHQAVPWALPSAQADTDLFSPLLRFRSWSSPAWAPTAAPLPSPTLRKAQGRPLIRALLWLCSRPPSGSGPKSCDGLRVTAGPAAPVPHSCFLSALLYPSVLSGSPVQTHPSRRSSLTLLRVRTFAPEASFAWLSLYFLQAIARSTWTSYLKFFRSSLGFPGSRLLVFLFCEALNHLLTQPGMYLLPWSIFLVCRPFSDPALDTRAGISDSRTDPEGLEPRSTPGGPSGHHHRVNQRRVLSRLSVCFVSLRPLTCCPVLLEDTLYEVFVPLTKPGHVPPK